ncbi:hypothetical protein TNCV_3284871 [Trichonephila clavipes]|nr:hypothetical protein TNCV_3284871 [Trichonephila clavipes]
MLIPSGGPLLNRRSCVDCVMPSPIPYLEICDVGHGESGVLHSAEWHYGDWLSRGDPGAWFWFFIMAKSWICSSSSLALLLLALAQDDELAGIKKLPSFAIRY